MASASCSANKLFSGSAIAIMRAEIWHFDFIVVEVLNYCTPLG
jgi:hypothetical protein